MTPTGHKLLLINKKNGSAEVAVEGVDKATVLVVDGDTGDNAARSVKAADGKITLEPFAVAVVSW